MTHNSTYAQYRIQNQKHAVRVTFFFTLLLVSVSVFSQTLTDNIMNVYFFPGQGSDFRIFDKIQFNIPVATHFMTYPVPEKGATMSEYADVLLHQIDTSQPFVLIGVSLGGMLCTEIAGKCSPELTILISSASKRSELPIRYTFMKYLPVYKIVPANLLKAGAYIAQPLVEPDRRHGKQTFISMLRAKDPRFIKRSTEMIINWDRSENHSNIVRIHGTTDHTLPIRRVRSDYIIQKGSHMMTYTRGNEISTLINDLIKEKSIEKTAEDEMR